MIFIKKIICLLVSFMSMMQFYHGKGDGDFMKNADVDITLNPLKTFQEFDGFGASACWWAQSAGNSEYSEEIAKSLFSKDGLGLNIYRYNIGGGEKDNPNSRIGGSRATESFYYYNEATGKYEYDFSRDDGAQKMLDLCLSYGCIDTVVMFANSPHYSMTKSGQATGGTEEYTSNLLKENYKAYADYFLTITQYFIDKGVPVKFVSPINEPQWSWGGGWVGQEGCHYEPDEAVALFEVFADEIKDRNMNVKLMAPESGEIGDTTNQYFESLYNDEKLESVLGSLAYHSYWSDNYADKKSAFGDVVREKYQDISVDMTEWCELPCAHSIDDFGGAVLMARVISQDIALSNANSWTAWVGVNNYSIGEDGKKYSDGLLVSNEETTELYTGMRYYALAHFSKYIPKGSVRIGTSTDVYDSFSHEWDNGEGESFKSLNISAFKTPEGKVVCVLVNEGGDRNVRMSYLIGNMTVVTSTAAQQMQTVYDGCAKSLVKLPSNSITTIIYE